jgi:hypothetical protein
MSVPFNDPNDVFNGQTLVLIVFLSHSVDAVVLDYVDAWPSKPMRATSSEKPLQKVHCLTASLRLLQVSSQRLKNSLGRLFSRC